MSNSSVTGQGQIRRVLVTGISGNLGRRLAPLLEGYEVISADLFPPPAGVRAGEFHSVDLSAAEGREALARLIAASRVDAVLHLAFVVDQVRTGILDRERMRQTNVEGTRRVLESVAEANRGGTQVRLLVYLSSVSAYGTGQPALIREDAPLAAHTLPYAIDKRETDLLCQQMFERLGGAALYIFRPHIYAGAGIHNWLIDGVCGRASGRGWLARWARRRGWHIPVALPHGADLENRIQLVHADDVARLLAWTVKSYRAGSLEIFNVAGDGAMTLEECMRTSRTPVIRMGGERTVRMMLRVFYALGVSAVPAEALPYYLAPPTMDTSRLRGLLGKDFKEVVEYSTQEALEDSLRE
ncbi:MAG TPA: NAD-dependent epimerase/dehydratase family protein [Candidatus Acidoferrales bacterium]|nr:NAD-dependent epimerase/dehydratase family protein [Candidatus Acidoferrales bacterium]